MKEESRQDDKIMEEGIDRAMLQIMQARCTSFKDMPFEQYRALRLAEEAISADATPRETALENAIADITRYGENRDIVDFFVQTFLYHTKEQGRKAVVCGRHGMVIYLGLGTWKKDDGNQLGLLSTHTPGSSGGGGHGFNGNRRICVGRVNGYDRIIDPEQWLKGTFAQAYEQSWGEIGYVDNDRMISRAFFTPLFHQTKNGMRVAVDNEK